MATNYSPRVVTRDLILCLDAANPDSYSRSGNIWRDISGNNYDFTLINSPTFETHRGTQCFNFSGVNDYATRAGSISHDIGTACTLTIVMASINNQNFEPCSRLFSVNDGSANNVDYWQYFTLAACDVTKFGLWYKEDPGYLLPTSSLKTPQDDYKIVTYKWTASNTASIFVNGVQEVSSSITSAFNYLQVQRMTIGMNSALNLENANVRVAYVVMYNRELTASEVLQNFNALKGRFNI